jgi:eukaryotic-like serine/threonine-protein kinase
MTDSFPSPSRFARVRELFDAALERTGEERTRFLLEACAGDAPLHAEVTSLLQALERHVRSGEASVPSVVASEAVFVGLGHQSLIGSRIGVYEVVRLIGEGGMGAVFEGVRADDQYRKRVALKFLKRGLAGELAMQRFRYERQILANLGHANIATLLDGGVTEDGQPYIVMEYVQGTPITHFADARALDVRARLGLLLQVCAAVQHAHSNLVVHRDLKPGNILVTEDGQVKLLDFGIARLLRESDESDQLPPTVGAVHALTPEYASPEQLRGMAVGTPSDVYSLGVVACELLAGQRPFDLRDRLLADVQAIVCTQPAPAPSSLPDNTTADGARRRRALQGDLDAILLQALRKEPERRYATAAQFADDLQRVLDGAPVAARRDALSYRLGKFLRRRRFEVAALSVVFLSLLGGIVSTSRAAARAERDQRVAEEANRFLSTMLAAADPGYQGADVTVRDMLAQAAQDVETEALSPEVEAQVRHTLGQTYYELGLYDSAAVHVEKAVALRERVYGEIDMRTSMSLSYLAALAEQRGELTKAESISRRMLRIQHALRPIDEGELATTYDNVARYVYGLGQLDSALALQRTGLVHRRRATDSSSMAALPYTLVNLAVSYMNRDDYRQAQQFVAEALDAEERVQGRESVTYGSIMRVYSQVYDGLGFPDSADARIRAAVAVLERAVGKEHPEYFRVLGVYAQLRVDAKDWPTAERVAREVVNAIGTHLPESNLYAAASLQNLGIARAAQGHVAEADDWLSRALALRRKMLPEGHWLIPASESVLGHHYAMTERLALGEPLMRQAITALTEARGESAQPTRLAAGRLAEALERHGQSDEAARWRVRATADSTSP